MFPDELDLPLPSPDDSTLIFPDERAPLNAAALLRIISAISKSITAALLALALQRTCLGVNSCLSCHWPMHIVNLLFHHPFPWMPTIHKTQHQHVIWHTNASWWWLRLCLCCFFQSWFVSMCLDSLARVSLRLRYVLVRNN